MKEGRKKQACTCTCMCYAHVFPCMNMYMYNSPTYVLYMHAHAILQVSHVILNGRIIVCRAEEFKDSHIEIMP